MLVCTVLSNYYSSTFYNSTVERYGLQAENIAHGKIYIDFASLYIDIIREPLALCI